MIASLLFWIQCSLLLLPAKDIETDYDQLYVYLSPAKDVEQRLYVRYYDEYSLQYKLVIIRESCDYDISGTASASSSGKTEVDKDSNGQAYAAVEFISKNSNLQVHLRISHDKEKAKIIMLGKNNSDNSCNFVNQQLMYSE